MTTRSDPLSDMTSPSVKILVAQNSDIIKELAEVKKSLHEGSSPDSFSPSVKILVAQNSAIIKELAEVKQSLNRLSTDGIAYREQDLYLEASINSISVGNSTNFDQPFRDSSGEIVRFSTISIVQVDILAPQLAATDSVTLRLYLLDSRREPQDIVAEFVGSSQVSGMWVAAFSNRRIEYRDLNESNKVHGRITNSSGNSAASLFTVRIYARISTLPRNS